MCSVLQVCVDCILLSVLVKKMPRIRKFNAKRAFRVTNIVNNNNNSDLLSTPVTNMPISAAETSSKSSNKLNSSSSQKSLIMIISQPWVLFSLNKKLN